MQRTIPISSLSANESIGKTLYKLLQLSKIINSISQNEIVFDFTTCKFLSIVAMSGIHGLIKTLKDSGKQVSYENLSPELNSFLNNNSFYDGLIIDRNFPFQEIQKYETKTYTPFFKFPSKDNIREKAVNTIQELIHRQTKIVGQYKMAIDYILSEYANNIAEHSDSDYGFIVAQTYPNLGYIDICIFDTGIGLFQSYLNSGKHNPQNENEALQLAIAGRSTKDLPDSRGFGISTTRDMVTEGLNGKFILWSGNPSYFQSKETGKRIFEFEESYFQGCLVALRLPLNIPSTFDFYSFVS